MQHAKQKGNLGFSATIKEFHRIGANVFTELGDLSRIDIIIEYNNCLLKVQVKYATESTNQSVIKLPLVKSGPNGYKYHYTKNDVDLFALYSELHDKVYFIPATEACKRKAQMNLRLKPTANFQKEGVVMASDFENLIDVLSSMGV